MSAAFDFDNDVTANGPLSPVQADDPFTRLFFDRTTTSGMRLLAVAEPVEHKPEGYLAAAAAIAAFEEALSFSIGSGVESGLIRAFSAANDALRSGNRRVMASKRMFVGITAFVIDGKNATIGFVPPGQALLIQDGRLYGVPDLASWKSGFMPLSDQETPEPLGFTTTVRPQIRKTEIGVDDQIVLGASAVGRVLAEHETAHFADGATPAVIDRLEEALAESGVDDAYAAWIRCDPAPVPTVSPERLAEFERIWAGEQPPKLVQSFRPEFASDPKMRRAAKLDSIHSAIIETSERMFARKEPECLPLESRRRMATPPGALSLERYSAPRLFHVGQGMRSRLPRGLNVSARSLIGALVILGLIAGLALSGNVALSRGSNEDQLLQTVNREMQLAQGADNVVDANLHLQIAEKSINKALDKGASLEAVAGWRNQIAVLSDRINGVSRLTNAHRIGSLSPEMQASDLQVLFAFDRLFLVSDGVYEVAESGHQLLPLLSEGDLVGSTTVGAITTAASDENGLVVSDGKSVFFLDRNGNWSADRLEIEQDAASSISGLYKGNYFLLNAPTAQVTRLTGNETPIEPDELLTDEALAAVKQPVDLAVDGYVYLLQADGSVKVFYKGEVKGTINVLMADSQKNVVGLYRGETDSDLYVVAVDDGVASLALYDRTERKTSIYALPTKMHSTYDATAEEAFGEVIDFVVDESAGKIYFLTDDCIWQATLN